MSQPKRLRTAVDVLTTVPEMVGYFPQNSLVIIPFTHGYGRACIRIDLPADEREVPAHDYAEFVLHQVTRLPDANEVVLVVFSDAPISGARVPFARHQQMIGDLLIAAGIRVRGALCWARNGWSSLDGSESGPLAELESAAMLGLAASFEDFAAIPSAEERTVGLLASAIGSRSRMPNPIDLFTAIAVWESLLRQGEGLPTHERVMAQAILAVALRDTVLAECILANAAYGPEVAEELELVWLTLDRQDGQQVDNLITDRLETEPVSVTRVAGGILLLRDLIASLPEAETGHAYAALSWLEWAKGASSLASHYAREALRRERMHPLALTVATACDHGVTPGWIREVGVSGGFTDEDFDALLGVAE